MSLFIEINIDPGSSFELDEDSKTALDDAIPDVDKISIQHQSLKKPNIELKHELDQNSEFIKVTDADVSESPSTAINHEFLTAVPLKRMTSHTSKLSPNGNSSMLDASFNKRNSDSGGLLDVSMRRRMSTKKSSNFLSPGDQNLSLSRKQSFSNSFSATDENAPLDLNQTLHTLPFFQGSKSTDAFIADISSEMKIRNFKHGDSVINFGDAAKCMYLILKGELSIVSEDAEVEYATLSAGNFVGEIGVLFHVARTANVRSKGKSILSALSLELLESKMEKYPDIKEIIMIKGQQRLDEIEAIQNRQIQAHEKNSDQSRLNISPRGSIGSLSRSMNIKTLGIELGNSKRESICMIDSLELSFIPKSSSILKGTLDENDSQLLLNSRRKSINPPTNDPLTKSAILRRGTVKKNGGLSDSIARHQSIYNAENIQNIDVSLKKRVSFSLVQSPENDALEIKSPENTIDSTAAPIDTSLSFSKQIETEVLRKSIGENTSPSFVYFDEKDESEDAVLQMMVNDIEWNDDDDFISPAVDHAQEYKKDVSITQDQTLEEKKLTIKPNLINCSARRQTIAVWNDPELLQKSSKVKKPSVGHSRFSNQGVLSQSNEEPLNIDSKYINSDEKDSVKIILELIISYLDLKQLFKFRLLCSEMDHLILLKKPSILVNLDLSPYKKKITDKYIKPIAQFSGSLAERIYLHGCWQIGNSGIQELFLKAKNLTSLNLSEVWDITDNSIFTLSQNCKSLKSIDMSNMRKITNEAVLHLLDNCCFLIHLCLNYCKTLTDSVLDHESWKQIETVTFQRCTAISDKGFEIWTMNTDASEMWIQSRKTLVTGSNLAFGDEVIDEIGEIDELCEIEDSKSDNFSNSGSGEKLNHEMKSLDDLSQFSSNDWGEIHRGSSVNGVSNSYSEMTTSLDLDTKSRSSFNQKSNKSISLKIYDTMESKDSLMDEGSFDLDESISKSLQAFKQKSDSSLDLKMESNSSFSQSKNFKFDSKSELSLSRESIGKKCLFQLKNLSLRDCSFLTDSAVASIACMCGSLRNLNLSFCCSLTEDLARHLVKGCSKLTYLDVSYCGGAITDSTLLHFSTGLPKLQGLSIRGCVQVTDVGIDHLLENCHNMKLINVTQCRNISKETIEKMSECWEMLATESVCDIPNV